MRVNSGEEREKAGGGEREGEGDRVEVTNRGMGQKEMSGKRGDKREMEKDKRGERGKQGEVADGDGESRQLKKASPKKNKRNPSGKGWKRLARISNKEGAVKGGNGKGEGDGFLGQKRENGGGGKEEEEEERGKKMRVQVEEDAGNKIQRFRRRLLRCSPVGNYESLDLECSWIGKPPSIP